MQRRLDAFVRFNPDLRKATLYRLKAGAPQRVASTNQAEIGGAVKQHDVASIATGRYEYEEAREAGEHLGEVSFPLTAGGPSPVAALGLSFDLAPLDAARADTQRRFLVAALAAAVLIPLLIGLLLQVLAFRPLRRLRSATQRLAEGDLRTHLDWTRRDEIGELARGVDGMADALGAAHLRLSELTSHDPLTDLLNYRAFQERLHAELERCRRGGHELALVALDVDFFKQVNDRFGHATGDDALRAVARILREQLRPIDVCGRIGGDELMAALVEAGAGEAELVVRRLRDAFAATSIGPDGETITVSAGIAVFPADAGDRSELMARADAALYRAKSLGRNRYAVFSPASDRELDPAERGEAGVLQNTIFALARAVDAKDGFTHMHSARVAAYAAALAEDMGLSKERVDLIRAAGTLHDIGKIGIPDSILLKPGVLSFEDFQAIQRHSDVAGDIIASAGLTEIGTWVRYLHERWDGQGYPTGLRGDEIPLESRILAAADALEAMTSSRLYRPSLALEEALMEFELMAGAQFDPRIASRLVALVRSGSLLVGAVGPLERVAAAAAFTER